MTALALATDRQTLAILLGIIQLPITIIINFIIDTTIPRIEKNRTQVFDNLQFFTKGLYCIKIDCSFFFLISQMVKMTKVTIQRQPPLEDKLKIKGIGKTKSTPKLHFLYRQENINTATR